MDIFKIGGTSWSQYRKKMLHLKIFPHNPHFSHLSHARLLESPSVIEPDFLNPNFSQHCANLPSTTQAPDGRSSNDLTRLTLYHTQTFHHALSVIERPRTKVFKTQFAPRTYVRRRSSTIVHVTPYPEHMLACPEMWRDANWSRSPSEQPRLTHDMKTWNIQQQKSFNLKYLKL